MAITGKIHSFETCGTVDGPGIRFVIFTQGCPLRCQYCHNPDTWELKNGKEVTVDELMSEIEKYKSYMRFSGGGVTASGGEPLMQPDFIKTLFKRCREQGIHTTLDTSGFVHLDKAKLVLDYTDLVLLDIKSINPKIFKDLTGAPNDPTLRLAKHLSKINKPVWIRYVLVPNLTDHFEDIEALAAFLSTLNNVEKVEVLPFHKMGEFKWEELGYDYKLKNTPEPNPQLVETAIEIFRKYDLNVEGPS